MLLDLVEPGCGACLVSFSVDARETVPLAVAFPLSPQRF